MNLWLLITQNSEIIISASLALIGVLKLTRWGQARAEALDTLVGIIENLNLREAKSMVVAQQSRLSDSAVAAIEHAVSKADPKKRVRPIWRRLGEELLREWMPRR